MSVTKRLSLGAQAAIAASVIALASCADGLLVKPAHELPLRLALAIVPAGAVTGTDADACAKANSARVTLFQNDTPALDTTVVVAGPCSNPIALRVPFNVALGAMELNVVLRAEGQPVFQGSASVELRRGQQTDALVSVSPVAATILAPDSLRTFTRLGDSIPLGGTVLYATGDTVQGIAPTWTDDGKGIVSVANGFVRSRAEGSAVLTASAGAAAHATRVRVAAVVASVTIAGVADTANQVVGSTRTFTAVARDSGGNALQRPILWGSQLTNVATVSAGGVVNALALGRTLITAGSEAKADSFTLSVGPARVGVTPATASLTLGQTQQFTATAYDAANNPLRNATFGWTTSNGKVAGVSPSGLVTGYGGGTAQVTAVSWGISGTASLSVEQLVASPGSVRDTLLWGSNTPNVRTVGLSNLGTAVLGGLTVTVSYQCPAGAGCPAFIGSSSVNPTTTPATLTLQLVNDGMMCDGTSTATVTVWSSRAGAAVDIPVTHTALSPFGC